MTVYTNNLNNGLLKALFSAEDISNIKAMLSDYEDSKVSEFISYLNYLSSVKYRYMYLTDMRGLKYKDIAANRIALLNKCVNLSSKLSSLDKAFSDYVEPEMPYFDFLKDEDGKAMPNFDVEVSPHKHFDHIKKEADKLNNDLARFIYLLENLIQNQSHYSSKGRKSNNSDKFYTQLAELYHIYIDEPSITKGKFAELVQIVNEIIGIKPKDFDPSRAVKQAINELKIKLAQQNTETIRE